MNTTKNTIGTCAGLQIEQVADERSTFVDFGWMFHGLHAKQLLAGDKTARMVQENATFIIENDTTAKVHLAFHMQGIVLIALHDLSCLFLRCL